MRLDQLLRFLRFARTRGAAQRWIGVGHIRRNGARVTRRDQPVAVGDVLTLPLRSRAAEAHSCYRPLDAAGAFAIAGGEAQDDDGPPGGSTQP